MQRPILLAVVLAFAAALVAFLLFFRGDALPPPMPPAGDGGQVATPSETEGVAEGGVEVAAGPASVREAAAKIVDPIFEDPDIRAGLCGFKGRVVDHVKTPVADCGVRLYRGAMDSFLPENLDLFADAPSDYAPRFVAGETRTGEDGRWQVTGVWPDGIYLLLAGIDTDSPTHQIITRTPSRGQIVDLGDIVLDDAGVIVGRVLDEDGEPMNGALVRALDIPGPMAAFFPIERIDPHGAVLVREPGSPVKVVEMPPWAETVFEQLPVPTTRTLPDGTFRLVGVTPGSNVLMTTAPEYLSDKKMSVQVRAGQERDVGTIRMRRGEELYARVVDEKGKPVPGAEVLAGSTLSLVPFDLAQRLGEANADGVVEGTGFSAGKVTVAARRSPREGWVLAQPQSIMDEVTVTLPASFSIDVTVKLADGKPAEAPRLRLLPGKRGDGAAEMVLMGVTRPISLDDRLENPEPGLWRITGLIAGHYTLLADAPGHAMASSTVNLVDADGKTELVLPLPQVFTVMVVDEAAAPIRNVTIFAEARGSRVVEMPVRCGRTADDGKLVIDTLVGEQLRVSADHPKWGTAHGEMKVGEVLTLTMKTPGSLRGTLMENGKPPEAGKFTVGVVRRNRGSGRGAIEQTPMMVSADAEGVFTVQAMQPGTYVCMAVNSLDSLRSPGGMIGYMQSMFMGRGGGGPARGGNQVEIASGQVAEVTLQVGEEPIEGPTAQLMGSLTVDGRLGVDHMVQARADGRRYMVKVDERGRFDCGTLPATNVYVMVMGPDGFFMGGGESLWSTRIELKEGEVRDLLIDVRTSSIAGVCIGPDGEPASKVYVSANGLLKGGSEQREHASQSTVTDDDGRFRFGQVPEGQWSIDARGGGRDDPLRGKLQGVVVEAGVPVVGLRVELIVPPQVRGRIDLTVLPKKPNWGWLSANRLEPGEPDDAGGTHADSTGVRGEGQFSFEDLREGRHRFWYHCSIDGEQQNYDCGVVTVPAGGIKDLVLTPRK